MSLHIYGHLNGGHKLLISLMRPARLERATFWFVARSGHLAPIHIWRHLSTFSTSCSHWLVRHYTPRSLVALPRRCSKPSWLRDPRIHAEYGLMEGENPACVVVAMYRNQVVWRIPEELMKRVSQSRFSATMLIGHDFDNRGLSRPERCSVIEVG